MSQRAFTLIELSIVLVIIGLIVGGVLVGKDLIEAATQRAIISENEKLITAISTFRLKYNGLPGDITNATQFWGTDPGGCPNTAYNTTPKLETCDGNGDGSIGGYYQPGNCGAFNASFNRENHRFWQQLANAGLIDGQYTGATGSNGNFYPQIIGVNAPTSKAGGGVGITTIGNMNCSYSSGAWFAAYYNFVTYVGKQQPNDLGDYPFINPTGALSIDMKMDDGKPATGRVMVYAPGWAYQVGCASNGTVNAIYDITQTGKNCTLLFNQRL